MRKSPWKSTWHSKVPKKVAFFAKKATLGKVLTLDNLIKHNVVILN